jgi:TRAP-type uncharacterized transport system substrate-binding protein
MTAQRVRDAIRDLAISAGPMVLLLVVGLWVAFQFVKPAPPRSFVMTTGAPDGAYHLFSERYRAVLARQGITIELRPSAGAVENLNRLTDPSSGVTAGLVQGGLAPANVTGVTSLGAMFYEPLWVLYRGERRLERINELANLRIAVGAAGSGTQAIARRLLVASVGERATLLDVGGTDAVESLRRRRVDAAFFAGAPDAPTVQRALGLRGVRLMSIVNAEAYARRFPFLATVVLPRGVIDLAADVPGEDVTLLASTANLIVRDDLHPALVSLLLQAATEVHAPAGILQRRGEFPAPRESDIPLSADALRYYRSGKPFLERFLPFWVANFIERMVVLLVPLIAILVPAAKFIPALYRWRVRGRISRWYAELRQLESAPPSESSLHRVEEIERGVRDIRVPVGYANDVYHLRSHVELVRDALQRAVSSSQKAEISR